MENKKARQNVLSQIHIATVTLQPEQQVADGKAAKRLSDYDYMLMSWYDRDRNFEFPQSTGECHEGCSIPGYVDYGLHHGATLNVDIENGRFVFFYTPVQ
ncbi:MAG: hypothetical protein GQ559_00595 [Desulfobulbaceae bacterium]|nr:hypothetical protein [Desulfobulbaceae bacterium]